MVSSEITASALRWRCATDRLRSPSGSWWAWVWAGRTGRSSQTQSTVTTRPTTASAMAERYSTASATNSRCTLSTAMVTAVMARTTALAKPAR